MLRALIALALLALAGNACAQLGAMTLTYTPPTQKTDGSAYNDPDGYKAYWGISPGNYPYSARISNPATTSYQITNLSAGTWFATVTAIDKAGGESVMPTPVSKLVSATPPKPQAPGMLKTMGETVYTLVQTADKIALVAVGTLALGTACDPTQPVLDKYVVPRASVTWFGTVQPQLVVGACGG